MNKSRKFYRLIAVSAAALLLLGAVLFVGTSSNAATYRHRHVSRIVPNAPAYFCGGYASLWIPLSWRRPCQYLVR